MQDQEPEKLAETAPASDDCVMRFRTERGGASGRIVRLGLVVDTILNRHDYPDSVSELLGQAVALTALFAASLKFEGNFILQTKTDGPVDLLVVDYKAPGELRGYARFNREQIEALEHEGEASQGALLGHGHLAMTVDQGPEMERYQGVVALDGGSLNEAADTYFRQSEQLPTFVRAAVARHYLAGAEGAEGAWAWRAGGLLVQKMTLEGGEAAEGDDAPLLADDEDEDEDWNRVNLLAETVQDHELVDPLLSAERLLYRLFHEESVRAYRPKPLRVYCRCSLERVENLLHRFAPEDLKGMTEGGMIVVTCEFCNQRYSFEPSQFL